MVASRRDRDNCALSNTGRVTMGDHDQPVDRSSTPGDVVDRGVA